MTLDKLKLLKVRLLLESKHKQRMRRENQRFFIPSDYYLYGITKRELFKRKFLKELREEMGDNERGNKSDFGYEEKTAKR